MGINGLLQALKPIAKQVHVRKYDGQRVAVDGYSWLHKGAYCCARELCEGIWTDKFVVYFMSRIQLLRTNGLEPTVVFDGGRLPIKGEEEESRHRARAEARDKAAAHLAAGNVAMAQECYQRCVDVTPAMAKQVIEELKAQGVAFLVAPYEADAQMAYLARSGAVQLIITEDSDLLAYGCPRVLYKLDKTGTGEEISLSDLPNCPGLPLSGWTADQFLQLCVMAGCDFLGQMPGIGLKKAHGVLRKYRSFTKVVKMLRFNGTKVPPDYETRFQLALWAFRHARVYCTSEKALIHLAPLPGGGIGAADVDVPAAVVQLEKQQQDQKLDFLGPVLPPEVAQGIAEGDLDPNTHKPYDLAAIYAGCKRPPAHLAAQLAQLRPAADPAAAEQPFNSIEAAAAFSGGAVGKPRVGLSRRHAGQSGGSNRRWSGAAAGAGAYPGGARSGSSQPGGGASGGAKKRASLGIAKYFQKPAAAAAAAATQAGPSSTRAVGDAGSTQVARFAQAQAAAAPAQAAAPAAQSIKQSIAKAISTLGQQLQQRQQQQAADKQELLQQLTQQQQQGEAPRDDAVGVDVAFGLPPAKRHRSSGDLAAASAGAQALAESAGADSDSVAAANDNEAGDQALQQPTLNFDASLPISNSSLRLSGRSQSPAVDVSMSAGLGSAGALASGSSAGADLAPSQPGSAPLSSLDPSFLCGSSEGLGSQQPRARGAAVSALLALFGPAAAAGAGGFNRASSPAGFEDNMNLDTSQPLMGAAAAGMQDPAASWDMHFNGSSGAAGSGGGGYFSQPAGFPGSGGSSGLLGSGSDQHCSLDGCGSSSGLSLGALGVSTGVAQGPALWDGAAAVSFGLTAEQDMEPEDAAAGGTGSNASFRRMQQSLRTAFKQPQQQQQQQGAAADPGRSSFFIPPQQEQLEQPRLGRNSTARRHSRFKEQLLRGSSVGGTDDVLQGSPDGFDAVLGLAPDPQDSPDGLYEDVNQLQLRGQQCLRAAGQHQTQAAAAAAAAEEADEGGAVVAGTQRQRLQTPLLLSDSSEPSSGTTSNDENAEGADDALNHLGITHVKQYAKLAHKVVKTVAKQQQQQHAPLASRMGLLNAPAQWRPDTAALQTQQQRQQVAAGLGGAGPDDDAAEAAAAPATQRMRMQMGLSRGGVNSSRKGAKTKAGAGGGSFAAKLAGMRYDASMFVPLDQHQQQRQQREQEEEQAEEQGDVLQAGNGAGHARGMFGRGAGAAAAARKPFKAPWLAAKVALAEDSPSISDVLQNRGPAAAGGEGTRAAGFGAFGDFACGSGGGTGAKRGGAQKRGAKFGLR